MLLRGVLQGWASDGDGEGAAQLDEQMVRDFHFGGGLFERKKEGAGGDGGEEGGEEEGEEGGRQQRKSKKEVGAGAGAAVLRCSACLLYWRLQLGWLPACLQSDAGQRTCLD